MNTIGAAIERGEIESASITWEAFNDIYANPCANCKFAGVSKLGRVVCTLFEAPYNCIEPAPAVVTSLSSLVSVILRCSLKKEITA